MRGYVEKLEQLEKAGITPTYENIINSIKADLDEQIQALSTRAELHAPKPILPQA